MSDNTQFLESLKTAIYEKSSWYNQIELPKLLDNYRILHTCIKHLYDIFIKRGLITPDPYKNEKKISVIQAPDSSPFAESERSIKMGARFSDYESMLDYLCTYFKFSCDNLDLANIKRLTDLNNTFLWGNLTSNNSRTNTRELANILNTLKRNLDTLTLNMMNDYLSKSGKALSDITNILKDYTEFKKEEYKYQIRHQVIMCPKFTDNELKTQNEEIAEIKRVFQMVMGKTPYYSELIAQIAEEDIAENKESLRNKILEKLKIKVEVVKKEKKQVNTKEILLDSIHTLTTLSPTYSIITEKLNSNYKILEDENNTIFQRIKDYFRKIFNIKKSPVIYKFVIEDTKKQTKTIREVDINNFIKVIEKKAAFLKILGNKASPEAKKIQESSLEVILQFLSKQLADNKETLALLVAADNYFKANTSSSNRSKIKGLKIDLVSVNNTLVSANKKRAEFVLLSDELSQMEKLGINNE